MNTIKDKNDEKSGKHHTLISRIVKYFLIGTGLVFLLLIAFITWIYFSLFYGPGPMEMNDFHPFRSAKFKAAYLAVDEKMAKKWPVISEERFVKTSFGTTFMRISGPIGAPPLVLLPGGGCNSLIWHANIQAFSQYFRTYALDNIYDYGKSIYSRTVKNGNDFSDWLNEVFDTLQLGDSIRIVGYSYGGWVTSQYALHHPERLSHVVLIAPPFTVFPMSGKYVLRMLTTLIPIRYFKSNIMYWVWKDLAQKGDNGKQLVEDRIEYYQIALKSFKFKQPVNPTLLSDSEFQKLKMPVLFLIGEHETLYNANEAISRLNRVNPAIRTELIPGTGHDLLFTHTDMVNRKILEFLEK
jgi:pimeloyl-ACP methyl ester carboxylesterase